MTEFIEALSILNDSKEFKDWKKENPKSFLTYGFFMVSPDIINEWQIGYFNPDSEMITAFAVSDKVIRNPESEVFKDDSNVLELDLKKIKITLEKARDTFAKLQKEKYSAHIPQREMIILQNLKIGQIYNITCITNTYRTLNAKIDSVTGEIKKHELIDLFKVEK
ncbi:MAG: hypothetical protein ABIJ34_01090 [archaeon]